MKKCLVFAVMAGLTIGCTLFKVEVSKETAKETVSAAAQDVSWSVIQMILGQGKEQIAKIGTVEGRSKLMDLVVKQLVKAGLSDTDAKAEAAKLEPKLDALVKAVATGDKLKIGLAALGLLIVLGGIVWTIYKARKKKK